MTIVSLDFDGTIVDCRPRQRAVTIKILREIGLRDVAFNEIWSRKRKGESTQTALAALGLGDKLQEFSIRWRDLIEDDRFLSLDVLFPWTVRSLHELNRCSKLMLVSARQREEPLIKTLDYLGVRSLFKEAIVVPVEDAARHKSHALLRFRAVLHCGDTEIDARAAEAANIPFAAVTCGQRSGKVLAAARPTYLLENIGKLPPVIRNGVVPIPAVWK